MDGLKEYIAYLESKVRELEAQIAKDTLRRDVRDLLLQDVMDCFTHVTDWYERGKKCIEFHAPKEANDG